MKTLLYSFVIALFCAIGLISCDMSTESKPSNEITTPTPSTPANNAVNVPVVTQFEWTGTADKLQISMGPYFDNLKYDVAVSGQTHTVSAGVLVANTVYWWRVGQSYSGGISWCNNANKFTTKP